MIKVIGIILVLLASGRPASADTAPGCDCTSEKCYSALELGGRQFSFRGLLDKVTGYGAPGLGETPERDEKFFYYVLSLEQRICLQQGDGEDGYLLPVTQVQLTGDLGNLVEGRFVTSQQIIVARGYVWTGHSPWHQLPLLLEPTSLVPLK